MRSVLFMLLAFLGGFVSFDLAAEQKSPQSSGLKPFRKPGQPYAIGTPIIRPTLRTAVPPLSPSLSTRTPGGNSNSKRPEVTTQNFRRLNKNLGEWSGIVQGDGDVHLNLRIFRGGKIESVRYIGFVPLKDKASTFHFRSPIPSGQNWSWRIVAFVDTKVGIGPA